MIDVFVDHLRRHGNPGLQVEACPDIENRVSADIDAIAGKFAIEHTSIDSLPFQRRDADWFLKAAGHLERELPSLPFRLRITLQYDAISEGQDWDNIRRALKSWITSQAPNLRDGVHNFEKDEIPEVPFPVRAWKSISRPPGVIFSRLAPCDDTLPDRMRQQFDRKAHKLAQYQIGGKTTVLLVDSGDMGSMSDELMLEAIQSAYPNGLPIGVDEIWYADTSIPSEIIFRNFTRDIQGSIQE